MNFKEFAKTHPEAQPLPEYIAAEKEASRRAEQTAQERKQTAEQLKESILQQLEQGNAPELILYTAIKAIGLLSHDQDFTAAGQQCLDTVYADLAQQSLLTDTAAVAAHRLERMQQDYNAKLRTGLTRQLNGYRRIERALLEALQAVDHLEPKQEPEILE